MHNDFDKEKYIENINNTLVINLVGGPCCGKSTVSSGLFYQLKRAGYNTEVLPEFVKNNIYCDNMMVTKNQCYVFANEVFLMENLCQTVDIIIDDGSFFNNIIYDWRDDELFNKYSI